MTNNFLLHFFHFYNRENDPQPTISQFHARGVERAIRPFVLGRKKCLFSGSPRGALGTATVTK
jgi:hypothetical protein